MSIHHIKDLVEKEIVNIPKKGRVAVAMSGGVDSSVVAACAKDLGYEVIGITMHLYDQGKTTSLKKKACCAGKDIYDAKRVADKMGFDHYVLDYESVFKEEVIDKFVDDYLGGATPIPCIQCNQSVKFRDLLHVAKELDASALLTGHYVKRAANNTLHRPVDFGKDQTYFLFSTTKEQLEYLRFPLGNINKLQTRELAKYYDLCVSDKPDSQDICFVPSGGYAEVIKTMRPGSTKKGDIVDMSGKVLGTHEGIIHFTIGQRRGLGISAPQPLYVVRLDPEKNHVIVGEIKELFVQNIMLKDVNWLTDANEFEAHVKLRSTHTPVLAHVKKTTDTLAHVTLKNPEFGIAKGQACVFYNDTHVLGGGWIDRVY